MSTQQENISQKEIWTISETTSVSIICTQKLINLVKKYTIRIVLVP